MLEKGCYLGWPVFSGVPQVSMLDSLLFIININDLDDNFVNMISKLEHSKFTTGSR